MAAHPGLLIYSAKIHSLNLDAALTALTVLVVLDLRRSLSLGSGVTLGLVVGCATLERPTLLPFLALGAAAVVIRAPDRRAALQIMAVTAAVAVLIVTPWLIRNALVVGAPLMSSTMGEVLWRGNNPAATGGAFAADGRPILEAAPALRAAIWGRPEREQGEMFRSTAIAYMAEDPADTARRVLEKLGQFWWFGPHAGRAYRASWLEAYRLYYVVLAALAALGTYALARSRRWWALLVLVMAVLTISVAQSIAYVEGRHRWQVEPLLVVLATGGIDLVWRHLPSRRWGLPFARAG